MTLKDRIDITAFLAALPTTNTRIATTLFLVLLTALTYLYLLIVGGDAAIDESVFGMWLAFLSAFAGLDVAQFHFKRKTDREYAASQQPTARPNEEPKP